MTSLPRWRPALKLVLVAAACAVFAWGLINDLTRPLSPGPNDPVIADTHYDVTIDFTYKEKTYHQTWVNHCFVYDGNTYEGRSRWMGYAKRLPDGSAVFFKMRSDYCDNYISGNLVFGESAWRALWGRREPDGGRENIDSGRMAVAETHRHEIVSPIIYWMDSAIRPNRVELCATPACTAASQARVRILGIHGGVSQSSFASNPLAEIPALAFLTFGPRRYIGYACWRIPLDRLANITQVPVERWQDGAPGALFAQATLFNINADDLPTMAGWSDFRPTYKRIPDWAFLDDTLRQKVEMPIKSWRVGCERNGDAVRFGSDTLPPNAPLEMSAIPTSALSPTQFILPGGQKLPAGNKDKFGVNDESAGVYSSAAIYNKNTLLVAEATEFTISYLWNDG